MRALRLNFLPAWLVLAGLAASPAAAFDVILSTQGEYLDAYFFGPSGVLAKKVLVHPDNPYHGGRHLNGKVCFFPPNAPDGFRGKFVVADDTYREACVDTPVPQARCDPNDPNYVGNDPDGWGVFNSNATWAGSVITTGTAVTDPDHRGTADPQGCVFDRHANLIGNDVGGGSAGTASGNVILFFASSDYKEHCFLATNLAQPGMPVRDNGVVYVPQSGGGVITKFSAPFPQTPSDCHDEVVSGQTIRVPNADKTPTQEMFVVLLAFTPISMVRMPQALGLPGAPPSWYIGGVLLAPTILEVLETPTRGASLGIPIRPIVPPFVPENPIGMDVGSDGTVYYAELNLTVPELDTGCGRVSMVKFDPITGLVPLPPVVLRDNLRFPDGISVFDSSRFPGVDWNGLPDAPQFTPADCGGEQPVL